MHKITEQEKQGMPVMLLSQMANVEYAFYVCDSICICRRDVLHVQTLQTCYDSAPNSLRTKAKMCSGSNRQAISRTTI